jgi:hypothetical protein
VLTLFPYAREKDVCNEIPNDKVTPSMVYNKWSFHFLSHLDHYFCRYLCKRGKVRAQVSLSFYLFIYLELWYFKGVEYIFREKFDYMLWMSIIGTVIPHSIGLRCLLWTIVFLSTSALISSQPPWVSEIRLTYHRFYWLKSWTNDSIL